MFDDNLVEKLVKAIKISKGDKVLLQLWGEDDYKELLHKFSTAVKNNGAIPIEYQHSRIHYKNLFAEAEEKEINKESFQCFKEVDVVVDLCACAPVRPHDEFPKEKLDLYRSYMKRLFEVLATKEKFVQLRIPTSENALESALNEEEYKVRMVKAYDIDYDKLYIKAKSLVGDLEKNTATTIITGDNEKLSLSLKDRAWYIDAGDGDLPCGEVYIAPVENSAEGSILIDQVFLDDVKIEGLRLEFKEGKIVNSNSDIFNEFLETLPPSSDILCEFGIGLNENVTEIIGYTPLDEKASGTYHIAIGANSMFGGKNNCNFHMDFVFYGKVEFE
ncbi:aminopeptidase [Clostridium manihotivorum]|nr:aminopeptidase [Clostridium manihotivorum]